jgi:cephalosporin hydroxylase
MAKKQIQGGITKMSPISGHEIERHMDVWDANDHINRPKCTMYGRPAQQAYTAFFLWEKLLGPLEFKRFVEVGTGYGNTSVFFMLHCIQKGATFVTHERMKNRSTNSSPLKEWLGLQEHCVVGDVYGPGISQALMQ